MSIRFRLATQLIGSLVNYLKIHKKNASLTDKGVQQTNDIFKHIMESIDKSDREFTQSFLELISSSSETFKNSIRLKQILINNLITFFNVRGYVNTHKKNIRVRMVQVSMAGSFPYDEKKEEHEAAISDINESKFDPDSTIDLFKGVEKFRVPESDKAIPSLLDIILNVLRKETTSILDKKGFTSGNITDMKRILMKKLPLNDINFFDGSYGDYLHYNQKINEYLGLLSEKANNIHDKKTEIEKGKANKVEKESGCSSASLDDPETNHNPSSMLFTLFNEKQEKRKLKTPEEKMAFKIFSNQIKQEPQSKQNRKSTKHDNNDEGLELLDLRQKNS